MGKKKAKAPRARADEKNESTLLENLLEQGQSELERFFVEAPVGELRKILEEGYCSNLVNALLDLRRASVKTFFERLVTGRKRAVAPAAALYHYKVYLTNPLPLELDATNGETLPNYYAILGVPRDASTLELDEAQKLLVKAFALENFSPGDREMGETRFREIAEAFSILRNPKTRETADRLLPDIKYLYPKREDLWLQSVKTLLS